MLASLLQSVRGSSVAKLSHFNHLNHLNGLYLNCMRKQLGDITTNSTHCIFKVNYSMRKRFPPKFMNSHWIWLVTNCIRIFKNLLKINEKKKTFQIKPKFDTKVELFELYMYTYATIEIERSKRCGIWNQSSTYLPCYLRFIQDKAFEHVTRKTLFRIWCSHHKKPHWIFERISDKKSINQGTYQLTFTYNIRRGHSI